MKINRSEKTNRSALEILEFLQGNEDTIARRQDAVVSISNSGDLLFYNVACGIDETETVLIERLESDSMGSTGWESATPADVVDWLEKQYHGMTILEMTQEERELFADLKRQNEPKPFTTPNPLIQRVTQLMVSMNHGDAVYCALREQGTFEKGSEEERNAASVLSSDWTNQAR